MPFVSLHQQHPGSAKGFAHLVFNVIHVQQNIGPPCGAHSPTDHNAGSTPGTFPFPWSIPSTTLLTLTEAISLCHSPLLVHTTDRTQTIGTFSETQNSRQTRFVAFRNAFLHNSTETTHKTTKLMNREFWHFVCSWLRCPNCHIDGTDQSPKSQNDLV